MTISIESIRLDGGTQPRAAIDYGVVGEYAEAIQGGAKFPAVTAFYDGTDYWLADGFHRVTAALRAGLTEIEADVQQGSRRDAVLFSVGVNAAHGLRRTNLDKRRAVETLLRDEEWVKWSDREIARRCAVNQSTVSRIRHELTDSLHQSEPNERTYTTKHGTTATMNTENIGKRTKPEPEYNFYESQPDEEAEEDETEYAIETTVDYAVDHIWDYIESILSEMPALTEKHAVINEVLKRVRSLSIEYNQQA